MESVGAWIDRFVDPSTRARGGDDLRRARTAIGILLFLSALVPVRAALLVVGGHVDMALVTAIAWTLGLGLLLAVRRGLPAVLIGYVLGLALVPIAAWMAWRNGGLYAAPVLGMMLVPLLAVFISGVRAGLLMAPIVAALYVALSLNTAGEQADVRERLAESIILLALTTGGALAFETQRARAREEAEAARTEAERALARAERASQAKSEFLAN
ncbi:MAG: hypothetical protein KC636_33965, partial [Myxococcales bacterium]|nr:hypothetical protein [Myxococcales bacterium]